MAIDPSITSATGTTSASIPSHVAGDLIVAFAFRDGNTTAPSLPSGQGWQSPPNATRAGTTCSHRTAYKVAASGSEATGTFTNATSLIVLVIKGAHRGQPIGNDAVNSGSSTSINFPALALQTQDSGSYVIGFCGHRSTNVSIDTAPSGMTNITSVSDATDECAAHRTTAGVASWSSQNASVGGTSSGWTSHVLEIRAAQNMEAGPGLQDLSNAITQIEAGLQSLRRGYAAIVEAPPAAAYWNPADKHADITLSDSDKKMVNSSGTGYRGVRSVTSHSSGKWYAEFVMTVQNGASSLVGIANGSANLASFVGADANGYGCYASGAQIYNNGSPASYGAAYALNDVMGLAVDIDAGRLYVRKNGVWQSSGDPDAGTGGLSISLAGAIFMMASETAILEQIQLRTDSAEFSNSAPSGFPAWG